MDWNRDGKVDGKDAWTYHNMISRENSNVDNDVENSQSTSSAGTQNTKNTHKSSSSELTDRGTVVIALTFVIGIASLFLGYASVIDDLIGIGIILFLVAQWLDS